MHLLLGHFITYSSTRRWMRRMASNGHASGDVATIRRTMTRRAHLATLERRFNATLRICAAKPRPASPLAAICIEA
jgi:hypothetical protein